MCIGQGYYLCVCVWMVLGGKGEDQGPHVQCLFLTLTFTIYLVQLGTSYCVSKLKTNKFNKFVVLVGGKGDFYVVHWSETIAITQERKVVSIDYLCNIQKCYCNGLT